MADDGPVLSLDPATAPVVEVPGPSREVFGSEADPIQSVRALGWTRDGQILLADAGRSVLLLSDEGDSLRTLGRPGEGPGEFRQLLMAVPLETGGAAWFDPALNRVTELSPAYDVARLWRPERALEAGSLFVALALTSDGVLLGAAIPAPTGGTDGSVQPSPRRDESVLWRYGSALRVTESGVDTVAELAVVRCRSDPPESPIEGGPDRQVECSPEGDMSAMAGGSRGIAVAPRDWAEVRVFGTDLEPEFTVRVSDPEAEPFSRVLRDDRGQLWLGHWRSPDWWIVMDDEAVRVELPEGFDLWDVAGGRALGVVRGPLGVQRVGVLELPADMADAGDRPAT